MERLIIAAAQRLFGWRISIKETVNGVFITNICLHDGNARLSRFFKDNGILAEYQGGTTYKILF